jgi:hypothetical protein
MFRIADAEMAEALLWYLWREHLPRVHPLRLTDGRTVRIFHTGTLNQDSGPDFLNAELAFGPGRKITGDVEIHLRPSDWRRHNHAYDARYNAVVLHVVMWNDEPPAPVLKQNGQHVPTLVLSEHLQASFETLRRRYERRRQAVFDTPFPCQSLTRTAPPATLQAIVHRAGEARLSAKTAAIAHRMTRVSPEQTLFEHLMRAAGYAKNTVPFLRLAQRLPMAAIRTMAAAGRRPGRIMDIQALLFGTAGLLPSQRTHPPPDPVPVNDYILDLEARWTACRKADEAHPMPDTAWHFFRLRPFNFPTVRLAGMGYLIDAGLDAGLDVHFLSSAQPFRHDPRRPRRVLRALRRILDTLLAPDADDYWLTHATFGGPAHARRETLIGPDRRKEMMINAVLPFLLAVAEQNQDHAGREALLQAYRLHPRLPDNTVLRAMKRLIFHRAPDRAGLIDSASLQQGLLRIEEETCREKACGQCRLFEGGG